ncbi:MAG: hypothetical protein ACKPGF_23620 [Microcystis panniformis]
MTNNIDHDRLFKELISTFFVEFIELFFPQLMDYLDRESITFLDKEVWFFRTYTVENSSSSLWG